MIGRHQITVSNKRIRYDFIINRNITILRGESATGKTQLIEMLSLYEQNGTESGIEVHSDKKCAVLGGTRWEQNLQEIHDSIVFIDEGKRFVSSQDFAEAIAKTDNYYVIVTRDSLANLPYSVDEIYGIRTSGKYRGIIYNEFYKLPQFGIPSIQRKTGNM